MKITDLDEFKGDKLTELVKGVYLLDIPSKKSQEIFLSIAKIAKDDDNELTEEELKERAIATSKYTNRVFSEMIRDEDGNQFSDLIDVDVDAILSAKMINDIMTALSQHLSPDTKKK